VRPLNTHILVLVLALVYLLLSRIAALRIVVQIGNTRDTYCQSMRCLGVSNPNIEDN
jgi:hypothetical protein